MFKTLKTEGVIMKVRVITASPRDGSLNTEDLVFTDDFESPAQDFVRNTLKVYIDQVIEMEIPSGFPLNSTFSRS